MDDDYDEYMDLEESGEWERLVFEMDKHNTRHEDEGSPAPYIPDRDKFN